MLIFLRMMTFSHKSIVKCWIQSEEYIKSPAKQNIQLKKTNKRSHVLVMQAFCNEILSLRDRR